MVMFRIISAITIMVSIYAALDQIELAFVGGGNANNLSIASVNLMIVAVLYYLGETRNWK